MHEKIDFTLELADLVAFMSDVATAIRMHTPYRYKSRRENAEDHCKHILWLSDSLHYFGELSRCIKLNEPEKVIYAIDCIIYRYNEYRTVGDKWISDPMMTFKDEPSEPEYGEFYDGWILDKGIMLMERIKEKAKQNENLTTVKS